jgi:endonuclease-8
MPEGHTIHRLAKDLNRTLRPTPLRASSPQGLFEAEAQQLDGLHLDRAHAYGKHLFLDFADGPAVHIHLGLIGKLRPKPPGTGIEGAIRLRLESDEALWDLTGPMICALIDRDEIDDITSQLGPDPLRRGAKRDDFVDRLSRRSVPISAALLDQGVIAGIGNVYRSEFCFLTGIKPSTPAKKLRSDQAEEIWDLAVDQLRLGVRLNRIVTRDPSEVGTTAGRIDDENRLYVYKREGEPCHRCGTEIRLTEIAKRKSWHCPSCQK